MQGRSYAATFLFASRRGFEAAHGVQREALRMEERMLEQHDELLTAAEAAEFLGLRLATIRKLTYRRQLPVIRPTGRRAVRFRRSHLEKVLKERTQPAFFNVAYGREGSERQ